MMKKKNNGMFPLMRFGCSVWRAMVGSIFPTLCLLLSAGTMFLTACGGGSSSSSQNSGALAGNWQVTMESPSDQSFVGLPGCDPSSSTSTALCLGGFLQQSSNAVTGAFVYGIALPNPPAPPTLCSSGSGRVTGSVNGQNVTLVSLGGCGNFRLNRDDQREWLDHDGDVYFHSRKGLRHSSKRTHLESDSSAAGHRSGAGHLA